MRYCGEKMSILRYRLPKVCPLEKGETWKKECVVTSLNLEQNVNGARLDNDKLGGGFSI